MEEMIRDMHDQGAGLVAIQAALKDAAHRHDDETLHGLAVIAGIVGDRISAMAERMQASVGVGVECRELVCKSFRHLS